MSQREYRGSSSFYPATARYSTEGLPLSNQPLPGTVQRVFLFLPSHCQVQYRGSSSFYPATARYSSDCVLFTVQYTLYLPCHCQVQYRLCAVHCTAHRLPTLPLPGKVQTAYMYAVQCTLYTNRSSCKPLPGTVLNT